MGKFPFYPQMDSMDCGPACLQMVLQHHGRYFPLPWLRSISFISREGVSLKGIGKAAERTGLRSMAVKIPFAGGSDAPCLLNAPFPLVAHWNQNHFIVVHKANKKYVWIAFFLKRRKEIDYRAFQQHSRTQDSLIEIIQGMPEIKLQGSQLKRRWRWAEIQAKLFRVQMSALRLGQWQEAGGSFINQAKDILITVIAATGVIKGDLTLGMMLAIQYIIGQLNGPLAQMINFIRSGQDAKISLERLGEIHAQAEEDGDDMGISKTVPRVGDLVLDDVSFRYNAIEDDVLKNVSLTIPEGKVTAIVGTSGSGKTTLLKLLLGFYPTTEGAIRVAGTEINQLDQNAWREHCGVVMQDGFIFSDTIANNISESSDFPDTERLDHALRVANIEGFVRSLPLGVNTMVGARGNGVSQGQRQRLLIARAVYKNPDYLFLDEATNSLDANNEREIIDQLDEFYAGKTVVVVAHRLSTVSHADQIVVLEQGEVVEVGSHQELVAAKGAYYTLVKNQLELGS
jgi:ATP-binding cassette subfamily B protein